MQPISETIHKKEKIYILLIANNNSNLRVVNMLPGDRSGLPDAFHTNFLFSKLMEVYYERYFNVCR